MTFLRNFVSQANVNNPTSLSSLSEQTIAKPCHFPLKLASKCVSCIYMDSKYRIQRTVLQNWLVITNKKLQKINTKTFYASRKENKEMKKSKTKKIHAAVFATCDHLDM